MLIVGAGGFAKEILQILAESFSPPDIVFYDDTTSFENKKVFNKYRVLRSFEEAGNYFINENPQFTIGIGNVVLRHQLYKKMLDKGGIFTSTISMHSYIGSENVTIGQGCNILAGVKISNDVNIGIGSMIYYNSILTHNVQIGNFVEISPGATILGNCQIGDFSWIGSGAIIFPNVEIGQNCIIGAGSVVRNNVADNTVVAGNPASIIKKNSRES